MENVNSSYLVEYG